VVPASVAGTTPTSPEAPADGATGEG
jgi:hypothetical protein